jgi:exosortase A-associated hydrolase 2
MHPSEVASSFLDTPHGAIHIVEHHCTQAQVRGDVLFVPPFGEEMNRCRRAMHLTAEALARRGFRSVLMDYFGTGESDGELAEATIEHWLTDIATVRTRIEQRGGDLSGVIAIRLGALLAFAEMARSGSVPRVVLWQPVSEGRQFLREMLRQLILSERLRGVIVSSSADELLEQMGSSGPTEIGGYVLGPKLAHALREATLLDCRLLPPTSIHWLETSTVGASAKVDDDGTSAALRAAGHRVNVVRMHESPFWTMTDPPVPNSLIDETVRLFG